MVLFVIKAEYCTCYFKTNANSAQPCCSAQPVSGAAVQIVQLQAECTAALAVAYLDPKGSLTQLMLDS